MYLLLSTLVKNIANYYSFDIEANCFESNITQLTTSNDLVEDKSQGNVNKLLAIEYGVQKQMRQRLVDR